MVVSHVSYILYVIMKLANSEYIIRSNFALGDNCFISLIEDDGEKHKIISIPNTHHFALYNKNYSNI